MLDFAGEMKCNETNTGRIDENDPSRGLGKERRSEREMECKREYVSEYMRACGHEAER